MEAGEMLNIQNSTPGVNHLTTSSRSSCLVAYNNQHQNSIQQHHHHHHHQDLPLTSVGSLSRAKSDTSLGMSNNTCNGANNAIYGTTAMALMSSQVIRNGNNEHGNCNLGSLAPPDNYRPKSIAPVVQVGHNAVNSDPAHVGYAKALFAYLSNGDNQLSFLEGDVIALIGK